jgi:hypothetical protein
MLLGKPRDQNKNTVSKTVFSVSLHNISGIADALRADKDIGVKDIGKVATFLPSSYKGSPRSFYQRYLDAMAIVRVYGAPTMFLTYTCNPMWPEIQGCLIFGVSIRIL